MASRNQGEVEILVHISAPSSGKDDERYRGLASAYLAFEPLRRKPNSQKDSSWHEPAADDQNVENQLQGEARESQSEDHQGPRFPLFDDGDDSYRESQSLANDSFHKSYLTRFHLYETLESPQASFGSVLDNGESPDFRPYPPVTGLREEIRPDASESQGWKTPPSEVADSQSPFQRPIPQYSSPTRILELYLQQFPIPISTSDGSPLGSIGRDEALDLSSQIGVGLLVSPRTPGNVISPLSSGQLYQEPEPIVLPSASAGSRRSISDLSRNEDDTTTSLQASSPSPTRPEPKRNCHNTSQVVTLEGTASSHETISQQNGLAKDAMASSSIQNCTAGRGFSLPATHCYQGTQRPSRSNHNSRCRLARQKNFLVTTSSVSTAHDATPQPNDLTSSGVLTSSSTRHIEIKPTPLLQPFLAKAATPFFVPKKRKQPTQEPPTAHSSSLPLTSKPLNTSITSKRITDTIYPPAPPTSTSTLPLTLLTPSLLKLASTLSLPTRYRPVTQVRPLRPLERGYWSIDTGGWGIEVSERAWSALGVYVGGGRAGWGVWCTRRRGGSETGGDRDEEDEWRVYCWGDAVGHVYLLLYLVSERRVKGTGARWIDGGGKMVVLMEAGG